MPCAFRQLLGLTRHGSTLRKVGPHERLAECERSNQWQKALDILADLVLLGGLVRKGPRADLRAYNMTLGACAGQQLWETTLQLFLRMTSSKMSPDLISLSAVVGACARASKQRQAVKFQQIWSDRCHRTTMFELLRFTRRLPNMERDEKVPAPRGSFFNIGSLVNRSLWAEALTLFWRIARCGEFEVTTKLLNIGLVACQRGHRSADALLLLKKSSSPELDWPEPDLESYSVTMRALGEAAARRPAHKADEVAEGWRQALLLLEELRLRRLSATTRTYNSLASACSRGHAWLEASKLLSTAVEEGLPWDLFSYNIAIQGCHRSAAGPKLSTLLRQMEHDEVEANAVTFTTAIGACERSQRWELALDFFRRLKASQDHIGAITSNSVMAACAAGHAWAESVKIFWDMLLSGTADAASMANVLKAYKTTSQWQEACWHLFEVPSAFQLETSWQHYVSVAEACSLVSLWQQALSLLWIPRALPVEYRFSAAISACKNAIVLAGPQAVGPQAVDGLWQHAVALYAQRKQQEDDTSSSADANDLVGTASALISVFEKMGMWESALQIFSEIQSPNRVNYVTILLALLAGGEPKLARKLYLQSPLVSQALRPLESLETSEIEDKELVTLDLHELPVEVATLALEDLLNDLQDPTDPSDPSDPNSEIRNSVQLHIITGHALHRSGVSPRRVWQAVLRLLETWPGAELRESSSDNPGLVSCVEVAKRLTNHVVLAELRTGKLPKDQADLLLKTLLLEQYFVCNSDLRTLKASCEKFAHAFALGEHQKMCQLLGLSDEQLEAHVPHHKCQAYPSYFCSILLHHSPVVAAAAFHVNFPAWGQMCGILRDSLLEHYGYQKEDLGFLDFFATPIPNLRELDQVFATGGEEVSYTQLRRSVRLLQEYELLFWDGIWEQAENVSLYHASQSECCWCRTSSKPGMV
eukprot:s1144_g8.t1